MKEFAMVLAGGGGKGAYQVGVFNALKEYDLKITAVSGASVGGINAYAYACLSNEEINKLWDEFSFGDFFSPDDDWSDGISDRDGLTKILEKYVDEYRIKNAIPIYNSIYRKIDESNGYTEYKKLNDYGKEEIIKILLATSAMPVIYSEVNIDGASYVDGGVGDNLPVKPLYDEGHTNIISVGLSKNGKINRAVYPCDEIIEILPSKDLGDLLDGTMNFSASYKSMAKKLGYMDAKRVLNAYFGISNGVHTVEFDYNQIQTELRQEKLQRSIDDNMAKLSKYF